MYIDMEWYDKYHNDDDKEWTKFCSHVFPDTGLLKSWCKFCAIEGSFNRETCKYDPVHEYNATDKRGTD